MREVQPHWAFCTARHGRSGRPQHHHRMRLVDIPFRMRLESCTVEVLCVPPQVLCRCWSFEVQHIYIYIILKYFKIVVSWLPRGSHLLEPNLKVYHLYGTISTMFTPCRKRFFNPCLGFCTWFSPHEPAIQHGKRQCGCEDSQVASMSGVLYIKSLHDSPSRPTTTWWCAARSKSAGGVVLRPGLCRACHILRKQVSMFRARPTF